LHQKCSERGPEKFQLSHKETSNFVVPWKRYEDVSVPVKSGEERRKIALVTKATPATKLCSYFRQLLKDYPYHSFKGKWQKEQFENLLDNLYPDNSICVHDFSENYTCSSKDEIQSEYFDPHKMSIHVSIVYRHASLQIDRKESTEVKKKVERRKAKAHQGTHNRSLQ